MVVTVVKTPGCLNVMQHFTWTIDKPGDATAATNSIGPYMEGHRSEIQLRCRVSNPGNPPARFRWTVQGTVKAVTNTSFYTIPSGNLSRSKHNGVWHCTPFNEIGAGRPGNIEVSVHSKCIRC